MKSKKENFLGKSAMQSALNHLPRLSLALPAVPEDPRVSFDAQIDKSDILLRKPTLQFFVATTDI